MKLFSFLNKENGKRNYKCPCCGIVYDELPLCFGSEYPDYYFSIPANERDQRIEFKKSLCVIDEQFFFHRCRLIIPIKDFNKNLIFDVWTTISAENFSKRMDLWEDQERINQESYFGWMQTLVPSYGDTLNIRISAKEQEVGLIPLVKSIEEGHLLTNDQENGITFKRAVEIVDEIMLKQHKVE